MRARLIGFCLLLLAVAVPAAASPITWTFTGTVTNVVNFSIPDLTLTIPLGTPVLITLSFDTASVDACAAANTGFFTSAGALFILPGPAVYSGSGGLEANFPGICTPHTPGVDYVLRIPVINGGGSPVARAYVHWFAPDGNADVVPTIRPDTVDFEFDALCCGGVRGFAAAVPEPATWLLLLTGGAVAVLWRRREL